MTPDQGGLEDGLAVLRAARAAAESPAPAARSRGTIALVEENCTVCMLCARECPDWCLYVEGHTEPAAPVRAGGRPRVRNVLDRFAIDWSLCMYCGICVEVCPFDALFWAPVEVPPTADRPGLVEERAALRAWVREVPVPPPLDAAAEPAEEVTAAARLDAVAAARTRR